MRPVTTADGETKRECGGRAGDQDRDGTQISFQQQQQQPQQQQQQQQQKEIGTDATTLRLGANDTVRSDDPLASLSSKPLLRMDEIDRFEPVDRPSIYRRKSFLEEFATSRGPPQIIVIMLLVALGLGSTAGIVPAVVSDRYARLNHHYTDSKDCSTYAVNTQPDACVAGNDDAQNAVAVAGLIQNGLTFSTSSFMGSISDERGRRGEFGCSPSLLLRARSSTRGWIRSFCLMFALARCCCCCLCRTIERTHTHTHTHT